MGMSPVADPAIWHYPIHGAGGNGFTIIQPITDSFLALDVWPHHDGAYLFICSCVPFYPALLEEPIAIAGLFEDDMSAPITLTLHNETM